MKAGVDFHLAFFSAERDDPANQQSKVKLIPKVVGDYTHWSVNYREPDDWARCIVDTRDAMVDVHARRKTLESVGTETPVPDLISFILPINKFVE